MVVYRFEAALPSSSLIARYDLRLLWDHNEQQAPHLLLSLPLLVRASCTLIPLVCCIFCVLPYRTGGSAVLDLIASCLRRSRKVRSLQASYVVPQLPQAKKLSFAHTAAVSSSFTGATETKQGDNANPSGPEEVSGKMVKGPKVAALWIVHDSGSCLEMAWEDTYRTWRRWWMTW